MKAPALTVLMPVYNGEEFLREAVESILNQTFTDFEFLIIDDGSTDRTPGILSEYARQDSRIRLERNERNMQIAATLNKGLALAAAPIIARMDADDVSLPDRLEKQVEFMREHPEVTVCGGVISIYGATDEIWLPSIEHEAIRAQLLFESCLYHPTVMYRKAQLGAYAGGYDISMPPAEDYDLWARLSMSPGARFANLPEIICRYRIYDKDKTYEARKQAKADLVREKLLRHIGLSPSEKEFRAHLALSLRPKMHSRSDLWACQKWLKKLRAAALAAEPAYGGEELERELKVRWLALCENNIAASAFGLTYFASEFSERSSQELFRVARILWRVFLGRIAVDFPGLFAVLKAVKAVLLRRMQRKITP